MKLLKIGIYIYENAKKKMSEYLPDRNRIN